MPRWFLRCPAPKAFETRDELRSAYRAIESLNADSLFDSEPSIRAPYAPGTLTDEARRNALDTVNFLRAVANLNPVGENALYDLRCAHGAVLLAANDFVAHDPPQPADMPDEFYASACAGTSESNLVGLNWMRPSILTEGIRYFARDDGETNLSVLGHRRWLLNPEMGERASDWQTLRQGRAMPSCTRLTNRQIAIGVRFSGLRRARFRWR